MKKLFLVLTFLSIVKHAQAQAPAWTQALNTIGGQPNFGTISNHPINFYTNNTMRMVLTTGGVLKINGLAGTGTRFMQTDEAGNLVAWTGSIPDKDKTLFGDATWRLPPFTVSGTNIYSASGNKVGIGVATPEAELDINGGAQVKNGLRVGEGLYIGPTDNYGLIRYTSGTGGKPSVFSFGGGGTAHPNNPSPGNTYNQFLGGHGAGDYSPDPQPNQYCLNGDTAAPRTVNLFQDVIIVKKHAPIAALGLLGNLRIGHNGNNAFIETQGTNGANPNAGDLWINAQCNRNVYMFSNGTTFAPTTDHVMSIAGRLNVTQNVQIGGGTLATSFEQQNSMLYVNSPGGSPTGIRIKHAGSEAGLRIIELNATKKALAINKGSGSVDGDEIFTVLGNGKTEIIPNGTDALNIVNGTGGVSTFNIKADGKTYIANSIGIGTQPTASTFIKIDAGSNSTNADLISLGSLGTPNAMKMDYKGVTNFNVDGITSGSVFKVKNSSNELFAIRYDGVAFAREVIVTTSAFPDYVFAKDYNLLTLETVKAYIKKNNRLPNMPSAEEVKRNGVAVGEIQRLTVEKVEELYLYIFQLEERIEALNSQIKAIEKK